MPFLLLLLLALACFPDKWPQPLAWVGIPDGNPLLFAGLTWLGVGLLVTAAARASRRTSRQLYLQPMFREETLHDFAVSRHRLLYGLYAYFLLSVFVLGWGWTVQTCLTPADSPVPLVGGAIARWVANPRAMLPGAELLVIAPFVVVLACYWFLYYDVERAAHRTGSPLEVLRPFSGRAAYVRFHLRQNLALIAAPLLLLIVDKGMRRALPAADYDRFFPAASWVLLAVIFVCLPWILRLALGLRPLPAGPMRDRLERCARRLGFRCSNILLWNTRGGVANAMIAGILPWLRYVLLSDRLLEELTPEEVEAVFGHEIGHVKHRHMFFYLSFLMLSVFVAAALWALGVGYFLESAAAPQRALAAAPNGPAAAQPAPRVRQGESDLEVVPLFALAGTYIFVVFGFLSRRCERQADIFGCRAVSCSRTDCHGHGPGDALAPHGRGLCPTGIQTFINALEKVARVNGINRNKPGWLQSWQHSTIARRVEFLERVLDDPGVEPRFQRTVALVKWGLVLTLAAILVWLGTVQGWDKLGLF